MTTIKRKYEHLKNKAYHEFETDNGKVYVGGNTGVLFFEDSASGYQTLADLVGGSISLHAITHENGGTDEISIVGLSGLLADGQTPLTHASTHISGSTDIIPVATTSNTGLLSVLSNTVTEYMDGTGNWSTPSGGGSYTFENGLTESSGTVKLGGTLTDLLTTITISDGLGGNNDADFRLEWDDSSYSGYFEMGYDQNGTMIRNYSSSGLTGDNTYLNTTSASITIAYSDGVDTSSIYINASQMLVTDSTNSKGFVYVTDYSTVGEADDRWIPDYAAVKAYADSVGGTTYNSGSGITVDGSNNIDLGGTLDATATIVQSTYAMVIEGDDGASLSSRFRHDYDTQYWASHSTTAHSYSNPYSQLMMFRGTYIEIMYNDGSASKTIRLNSAEMKVTDGVSSKGLVYSTDYSTAGEADDRWIPDYASVKSYADSVAGAVPEKVEFSLPSTNLSSNAITMEFTAGVNLSIGDVVYKAVTDGEMYLADANGTDTYPARGIAAGSGTDGNDVTIVLYGVIRNDNWSFPTGNWGKTLFLTETAGGFDVTPPTTTGHQLQVVGWIIDNDHIFVNCSPDWFEN